MFKHGEGTSAVIDKEKSLGETDIAKPVMD
jgi:hypothetical protein